jgi:hypothetical protein
MYPLRTLLLVVVLLFGCGPPNVERNAVIDKFREALIFQKDPAAASQYILAPDDAILALSGIREIHGEGYRATNTNNITTRLRGNDHEEDLTFVARAVGGRMAVVSEGDIERYVNEGRRLRAVREAALRRQHNR